MALEGDLVFQKLKEPVQKFIMNVLAGFNFVQSYIMSHPGAENNAIIRGRAWKLAARPDVRLIIDRENKLRASRIEEAAALTTENLLSMAFADVGEVIDENGKPRKLRELPDPLRKSITEIEVDGDCVKYRLGGKLKALEILGKMTNLFKEPKVELNVITEEERTKRILEIIQAAKDRESNGRS